MGWNYGSGLFGELIWIVQKNVSSDKARRNIYEHMFDAFRNEDWDTMDECRGSDPVYDEMLDELCPPEDDEDSGDEA